MKAGLQVYLENLAYVSLEDSYTTGKIEAIYGQHLLISYGLAGSLCEHVNLNGDRIVALTKKEFFMRMDARLRKKMDKLDSEQEQNSRILTALKIFQREL